MPIKTDIIKYFDNSSNIFLICKSSGHLHNTIAEAANKMAEALNQGKKIIACGNGGSMSDAMHFCSELVGKYKEVRHPLPAIALSDPGALSCIANDFGYEHVFRRPIMAYGQPGDVLLAISTSGKSQNVLKGMRQAHMQGMHVVGLTGANGFQWEGRNEDIVGLDFTEIRVNSDQTNIIQQVHITIIHLLVELIEKKLS